MEVLSAEVYQAVGVAGFVLYMLSYFLLQIGKIEGSGNAYILMNLSAASFVLVSLVHNFNLASALIQISWIFISLIGLIRFNLVKHSLSANR